MKAHQQRGADRRRQQSRWHVGERRNGFDRRARVAGMRLE